LNGKKVFQIFDGILEVIFYPDIVRVNNSTTLWIVAFVATMVTAYVQRVTGPSYPLAGETHFTGVAIHYDLPRTHGGPLPAVIQIQTTDSTVHGFIEWKRFKTEDPWTHITMRFSNGTLAAELPHQPPAGKLEYRLALSRGNEVAVVPGEEPLVIRFKGEVPLSILIPHIIAMFASMLFAARAGLEYFGGASRLRALTYWTIGFLLVGGIILGPIVQHYAFGEWWTGWPFGTDLTDTKTGIIVAMWFVVAIAVRKSRQAKRWASAAAIMTFVVFLIPHSLFGSELDYKLVDKNKSKTDTLIDRR